MSLRLPELPADPTAPFPPGESALRQPDGLLALGGDLSPTRLLNAYRHGIFPWYSEGQPILWWCPDPRTVFRTDSFKLPSRFRRTLRQLPWVVRADTAFEAVIDACARIPRNGQDGTWITPEMHAAYVALHRLGHAHSIEVWDGDRLVGGLYGVSIGQMFFGESMFSAESGGSKVAIGGLAHRMRQWGWPLIDAQVENPHLMALGARLIRRDRFLSQVATLTALPAPSGPWTDRFGNLGAVELARAP
ncbi:leucyl/phenylalanyl-tRNA--protein transferase [Lysobacter daejeonensis GH1-9]|uniref:Leucyl/phenylalanyl-tRNA--protein transferase n=1 Tax=Lysobacter daejeonensis GH1-9 TaxID=1385517 RepID=A0A0A0F0B2_9GAMM|nr:leucyl/phenylalanyl-tRNA--protein transferase [Lysobacter daejeonensis]KGM56214.1 leucyl/phenylalanyl-tRNA--protein transferase [Lysobacter daejeonensis GH1-9]